MCIRDSYRITNGPAFIDQYNFYHTDSPKKTIYKIKINKNNKIVSKKIFKKLSPYADDIWLYWMIRLNKRYLKKFGHLEKFNALQVHGEGVYYPLWKIQEYKKNQGHYHAWHTEQNYSRNTCQRLMVSMFYLNDVR